MNLKSSVYPAVIVACLLGLVGLVLLRLQVSVSIETNDTEESSLPESLPTPVPKPTEPVEQDTSPLSSPEPAEQKAHLGALRMSNQTDQPVRVALLARQSGATSAGQSTYGTPAHWDFAPGEGSRQGLILSLPEGNLKLKKGDILVAFAQDGSRRYWGPYVVGETATPIWNRQTSEWQLTLQP